MFLFLWDLLKNNLVAKSNVVLTLLYRNDELNIWFCIVDTHLWNVQVRKQQLELDMEKQTSSK